MNGQHVYEFLFVLSAILHSWQVKGLKLLHDGVPTTGNKSLALMDVNEMEEWDSLTLQEEQSEEYQLNQTKNEEKVVRAIEKELELTVESALDKVIHRVKKEFEEENGIIDIKGKKQKAERCYEILGGDRTNSSFVTRIQTACQRLLEVVSDFKHYWLNETWGDASWTEISLLFPEEDDCRKVISAFPCIEVSNDYSANVIRISKESLSHVMSYAVALEFIFLDEAMHEHRTSFLGNFSTILHEMKSVAVYLIDSLEACRETPNKKVLRTLTSQIYEPESHFIARRIRETAFFRQIERGTRHIIESFAFLETHYRGIYQSI